MLPVSAGLMSLQPWLPDPEMHIWQPRWPPYPESRQLLYRQCLHAIYRHTAGCFT
jgi:hypothetical protein